MAGRGAVWGGAKMGGPSLPVQVMNGLSECTAAADGRSYIASALVSHNLVGLESCIEAVIHVGKACLLLRSGD